MTKIFTLLLLMLTCGQLAAQITIEKQDYTYAYGDTTFFYALKDTDAPLPEAGEDMIWDYTAFQFDTEAVAVLAHSTDYNGDLVPEANGSSSNIVPVDLFPGAVQELQYFTVLNDTTFRTIARLNKAASFPLGALTGVPTDSLYYFNTLTRYDSAVVATTTDFPLNYGYGPFTTLTRFTQDLSITATPFMLNQTPGQLVGLRLDTTEVDGWGELRLTDPNSDLPLNIPVLLQSTYFGGVDSFYLGGAPAPPAILAAFNQTQGSTTYGNEFDFFGQGFSEAVLEVRVTKEGSIDLDMNVDAVGFISSQNDLTTLRLDVQLAPNPATDRVQLTFDKTDAAPWTLALLNTRGQTVLRRPLTGGQGTQQYTVALPTAPAGMYMYLMRDGTGRIVGSGTLVRQ